MKLSSRRNSYRLAAGLAVGALTFAACGSDGDNASTTVPADTTDGSSSSTSVEEYYDGGTIVDVASEAGQFDTLVAAVGAAGLAETLSSEGPFTVFAPTDDAFAALPDGLVDALLLPENKAALTAVLTYHVLDTAVPSSDVTTGAVRTLQGEEINVVANESGVTVNDVDVIVVDVNASNGVIHVLDEVLIPPSLDATALLVLDQVNEDPASDAPASDVPAAEAGTIVDVASEAGQFDTLVAAVGAAGLAETLSSEGPFTVFAPTDDAFAALPDGLVDALLLPENVEVLQNILTYHVLGTEVPSADVVSGDVLTLEGEPIRIAVTGDGVTVNAASVIAVDVNASNGVIHVIDSVLVPPSIDVTTLI